MRQNVGSGWCPSATLATRARQPKLLKTQTHLKAECGLGLVPQRHRGVPHALLEWRVGALFVQWAGGCVKMEVEIPRVRANPAIIDCYEQGSADKGRVVVVGGGALEPCCAHLRHRVGHPWEEVVQQAHEHARVVRR